MKKLISLIIVLSFSLSFSQINDDKEHIVLIGIKYGYPMIDTVIEIQQKQSVYILYHRNINKKNTILIKDNITTIDILD